MMLTKETVSFMMSCFSARTFVHLFHWLPLRAVVSLVGHLKVKTLLFRFITVGLTAMSSRLLASSYVLFGHCNSSET